MDYRIEKRGPIKLVCKRKRVAKLDNDTAVEDVYRFWDECRKDGTIEKLCGNIPSDTPMNGLLGISFSADLDQGEFPYGIGFALGENEMADTGFDVVEIPAYTYAVFVVHGKMPDAFTETYKRICTEFFPQSDYEYAGGVEFEVYPSADVQNPDYTCEIWIAVK